MNLPLVVGVGVLAAVLSYVSARYLSTKFVKMGITGNDIHKPGRPVTAEMGGLSVLFAFLIGSVVIMIVNNGPIAHQAGIQGNERIG